MAAVGFIYPHRANADPQSSWQLRRLVVTEAEEWRGEDEIVIHWGDVGSAVDPAEIARMVREERPSSLFGRTWIHYQRKTHVLSFAVDRLGLFPLLLAQRPNAGLLASDPSIMAQMLGQNARVPTEDCLELTAFGQLLGNRSLLGEVVHLHAGSVGGMEPSGTYFLRHATPFVPTAGVTTTPGQAMDALVAAVDTICRRDPEALVLADGSLATRMLLAAAHAAGRSPGLVAVGQAGSSSLKAVAELAAITGAKLYRGEVTPRHFASARQAVAQLSGGECPLTVSHPLIHPELVAQTRGHTLINGLGARLHAARQGENTRFSGLEAFTQAFPSLAEDMAARLARRMEVYRGSARDGFAAVDALTLGESIRRGEVAREYLSARDYARAHPLLDVSVLRAWHGLPLKQRRDGRFPLSVMEKLSPRLARLPPVPEETFSGHAVEDAPWLNRYLEDAPAPLYQALRQRGLAEGEIQTGMGKLLRGRERFMFLARLAAIDGWQGFLSQRRDAALLAA